MTQPSPHPNDAPAADWADLVRQIRSLNRWSQQTLAEHMQTDQATVSRWERGVSQPVFKARQQLEALADGAGLQSLAGIATVVRVSPFPMILLDRDGEVIAASPASGLRAGTGIVEQTPPDERGFLADFKGRLEAAGFWRAGGPASFEYAFQRGDETAGAVVVALAVRGHVYALVQKR